MEAGYILGNFFTAMHYNYFPSGAELSLEGNKEFGFIFCYGAL